MTFSLPRPLTVREEADLNFPRWSLSWVVDRALMGAEELWELIRRIDGLLLGGQPLRFGEPPEPRKGKPPWVPLTDVVRELSFDEGETVRSAVLRDRPDETGLRCYVMEYRDDASAPWKSASVGIGAGPEVPIPSGATLRSLLLDGVRILGDTRNAGLYVEVDWERFVEKRWLHENLWADYEFWIPRPEADDGVSIPVYYQHESAAKGGPPLMPGVGKFGFWMLWWGPVFLDAIGFPPERAPAIHEMKPFGRGVFFQSTEEPYDPRRTEHRAALRSFLSAFPEIPNRNPRARWPRRDRSGTFGCRQSRLEYQLACPPRTEGDRRPIALVEEIEAAYREEGGTVSPRLYELKVSMDWVDELVSEECRVLDREKFLLKIPSGGMRMVRAAEPKGVHVGGRGFHLPAPGYFLVNIATPWNSTDPNNVSMLRVNELLGRFARVLGAYWGCVLFSVDRAAAERQARLDPRVPYPEFLPRSTPPDELPDVYTPPFVGWVNYWSEETCARLGSPVATPSPLVRQAERAPGGGWIFRITDELMQASWIAEQQPIWAAAYTHLLGRFARP